MINLNSGYIYNNVYDLPSLALPAERGNLSKKRFESHSACGERQTFRRKDLNPTLPAERGNLFEEKLWIPLYLRREANLSKKSFESHSTCGERGIRTPETVSPFTRFPGVPLQPLEHLSLAFPRCKSNLFIPNSCIFTYFFSFFIG